MTWAELGDLYVHRYGRVTPDFRTFAINFCKHCHLPKELHAGRRKQKCIFLPTTFRTIVTEQGLADYRNFDWEKLAVREVR